MSLTSNNFAKLLKNNFSFKICKRFCSSLSSISATDSIKDKNTKLKFDDNDFFDSNQMSSQLNQIVSEMRKKGIKGLKNRTGSTELNVFRNLLLKSDKGMSSIKTLQDLREKLKLFCRWTPICSTHKQAKIKTSKAQDSPYSILIVPTDKESIKQSSGRTILHFHSLGLCAGDSLDVTGPVTEFYKQAQPRQIFCAGLRQFPEANNINEIVEDAVNAYKYVRNNLDVSSNSLILSADSSGVYILFEMLKRLHSKNPSKYLNVNHLQENLSKRNSRYPRLHPKPKSYFASSIVALCPQTDYNIQPSSSTESQKENLTDYFMTPEMISIIKETMNQQKLQNISCFNSFDSNLVQQLPRTLFITSFVKHTASNTDELQNFENKAVFDLRKLLNDQDPLIDYQIQHINCRSPSSFYQLPFINLFAESLNASWVASNFAVRGRA